MFRHLGRYAHLKAHYLPLGHGSATANLYLNSVVAYEVFDLSQNLKQRRKVSPPSLCKVIVTFHKR
jgi:hypothetical protein